MNGSVLCNTHIIYVHILIFRASCVPTFPIKSWTHSPFFWERKIFWKTCMFLCQWKEKSLQNLDWNLDTLPTGSGCIRKRLSPAQTYHSAGEPLCIVSNHSQMCCWPAVSTWKSGCKSCWGNTMWKRLAYNTFGSNRRQWREALLWNVKLHSCEGGIYSGPRSGPRAVVWRCLFWTALKPSFMSPVGLQ